MFIKNSLWNFAGIGLPAILSIPALGYLSRALTIEEFGLFIFLFGLAGVVTIFDFGFSRAITKAVAEAIPEDNSAKIAVKSTYPVLCILAVFVFFIAYFFAPFFSRKLFSDALPQEVLINGLRVFSITIPLILVNQFFIGVQEGLNNFRSLALQRVLGTGAVVSAPVVMVVCGYGLIGAIFGLCIGRAAYCFISCVSSYKLLPTKKVPYKFKVTKKIGLYAISFTWGNIINTGVAHVDKLIVASKTGAINYAAYGAGHELIGKLSLIPHSLSRALFPLLAQKKILGNKTIYGLAVRISFILSCVVSLLLAVFMEPLLLLWLGERLPSDVAVIAKILLIGFVFNAAAQPPFTRLQATGYANATAVIHAIEGVPYLISLLFAISYYGVIGAAICWSIRAAIDFLIMTTCAKKLCDEAEG